MVAGATAELNDGSIPLGTPGWFHYRNMGLFVPAGQRLTLETRTRTCGRNLIGTHTRDTAEHTARYLSVFAEHGRNPQDASYEAMLVLGATPDATAALVAAPVIVRADGELGAIAYRAADGSAGQAVFFGAGRSDVGSMDRAGVLSWKLDRGQLSVAAFTAHKGAVRIRLPIGVTTGPAPSGPGGVSSADGATDIEYESDGRNMRIWAIETSR
jgi:hyaluronate lyase